MDETKKRKGEHIEIVLNKMVQFRTKTTGLESVQFEDVDLVYDALPDFDKGSVSLETSFLGKRFNAPLMVSGMTGGIPEAGKINTDIAQACKMLGLGMGVGSQRAMIESKGLTSTYDVRTVAPDIFLAGNIGIAQVKTLSPQKIKDSVDAIGADALAVHLNAAQEAVQPEGESDFSQAIDHLTALCDYLSIPVYVKEVGNGIISDVAMKLSDTGIKAIDVQGAGGTTWIGVESFRGNQELGEAFWDVGVPTAVSILECRKSFKGPIVASGGMRTGLHIVKALALGADLAAMAYPVLKAQEQGGSEGVKDYLQSVIDQIKVGMFLVGAKDLSELKRK
ncbi:MAG: type 2 isopentenyl-diphosphate Delta-isomerase, partial [Nanoarchaeota archaeon]